MKTKNKFILAAIALTLCGVLCGSAVEKEVAVTAWPASEQYGSVGFSTADDGSATVYFQAQSPGNPPAFTMCGVLADMTVSSGAFTGDYVDAGVRGLRFKLRTDGHVPGSIMLLLKGGKSGRIWRCEKVEVPKEGGLWVETYISFDRSAGWTRDGKGDLDAMWQQDIRDVAAIGLRIAPKGSEAQSYSINNFVLMGANFMSENASLELVRTRFGVQSMAQLSDSQKKIDTDGDRMSDLDEISAGTNPDDASSVFEAYAVVEDKKGLVIVWPCVEGARYSVLRSTNMMHGFSVLVSGLEAAQTGYMSYEDKNVPEKDPCFYKIRKE